jgi:excisionase family DNA binding protein
MRLASSTQDRPAAVLISAVELAAMLNVSTRTLWRLLSKKQLIQPIKIGGATRWRLEEVDDWIAKGCPSPTPNAQ